MEPYPVNLDPAAVMWPTTLERIERAYDRFKTEKPLRKIARQDRAIRVLQRIDRVEPRKIWVGLATVMGAFAVILGPQQVTEPAPKSDVEQSGTKLSPAQIAAAVEDYKRG